MQGLWLWEHKYKFWSVCRCDLMFFLDVRALVHCYINFFMIGLDQIVCVMHIRVQIISHLMKKCIVLCFWFSERIYIAGILFRNDHFSITKRLIVKWIHNVKAFNYLIPLLSSQTSSRSHWIETFDTYYMAMWFKYDKLNVRWNISLHSW